MISPNSNSKFHQHKWSIFLCSYRNVCTIHQNLPSCWITEKKRNPHIKASDFIELSVHFGIRKYATQNLLLIWQISRTQIRLTTQLLIQSYLDTSLRHKKRAFSTGSRNHQPPNLIHDHSLSTSWKNAYV